MARGGVSGIALAALGAGIAVLYSGIKGKSITQSVQAIIQGKSPATAPTANPITGSASASGTGSGPSGTVTSYPTGSSSAQAALQNAASAYGWGSGAEWQALSSVEMAEAGFNPLARNPSSGAFGMAQALGHGEGAATAGTQANEYGGFGVSDAVAQAANSGDAGAQSTWMCQYIKATYGDPIAAWAHEQAYHWY